MKPPIIIDENGDISFFESVKDVELYLEPIDVINGEYVAYDSEGHILQLSVECKDSANIFSPLETVVLSPSATPQRHTAELKRILIDFFGRVGADKKWLSTASLEELITEGIKKYKTV
jgi:hypothetical protein